MGYDLIIANDFIVCKTSSFGVLTTFIVLRGLYSTPNESLRWENKRPYFRRLQNLVSSL
jgi:hypothetical protein